MDGFYFGLLLSASFRRIGYEDVPSNQHNNIFRVLHYYRTTGNLAHFYIFLVRFVHGNVPLLFLTSTDAPRKVFSLLPLDVYTFCIIQGRSGRGKKLFPFRVLLPCFLRVSIAFSPHGQRRTPHNTTCHSSYRHLHLRIGSKGRDCADKLYYPFCKLPSARSGFGCSCSGCSVSAAFFSQYRLLYSLMRSR